MNIIKQLKHNFIKHKKCLFCSSILSLNYSRKIWYLEHYPRYCYNCDIDFANIGLRIKVNDFIFCIDNDGYDDVAMFLGDTNRLKFIKYSEFSNCNTKEDLYIILNNHVKQEIFK